MQAYLISHGHMDHTAGLVVASPDDSYTTPRKVVAGTNFTIDTLQSHIFNWKVCSHVGPHSFTRPLMASELWIGARGRYGQIWAAEGTRR
jgi:phosphoribosyl 1,2-cyclic phosphodiesterase